jgi:hypothetical protein
VRAGARRPAPTNHGQLVHRFPRLAVSSEHDERSEHRSRRWRRLRPLPEGKSVALERGDYWLGRVGAAGAEHVMARFAMGRSWTDESCGP